MRHNVIYNDDAIKILRRLPDESIDLVFTDPPYNMDKSYTGVKDKRKQYPSWWRAWVTECYRVLKPAGSIYIKSLQQYLVWQLPVMEKTGFHFINVIIWRSISGCFYNRKFWGAYEPILFFGKTRDYKFNRYAETRDTGWRRFGGYRTEFKGQIKDIWDDNDLKRIYSGTIIHPEAILKRGTLKKANPCQMPVRLAQRGILFSTDPGEVVLDPFIGVGTTAVSAIRTRRRYIGVELSQYYARLARKRIKEEVANASN